MDFLKALGHTLEHEGGFVNHPQDPGGMTNLGVTKKALEAYLRHPVSEEDMRSLTQGDVEGFYREMYWEKASCDKLPSGIDYAVFDMAVHSGPVRAVKTLQEVIGFSGKAVDGALGDMTLTALQKSDKLITLLDYIWAREDFLRGLSTFQVFGKGWLARLRGVRNISLKALVC